MSHGGEKGTQNGVARILGYQVLFLGRLPGDHFNIIVISFNILRLSLNNILDSYSCIVLIEFCDEKTVHKKHA